ncbi:hypothetical protein VIBNISFn118_1670001 [Vibrio nigripulchritudo SFn118]|nr:hypothetical protein VIBNISFn118_1670001 [Vibrio nigripulchritudo SFn118]
MMRVRFPLHAPILSEYFNYLQSFICTALVLALLSVTMYLLRNRNAN